MSEAQTTLQEIRKVRQQKLDDIRAQGINPFPYRFEVTATSKEILAKPEKEYAEEVTLAGRIMSMRRMGKASFAHLQDSTGRIQVYVKKDIIGEDLYHALFGNVDMGDFLGVKGPIFRTRTGEITIEAQELTLLAKGLRPLPMVKEKDGEVFDAFEDKEHRYRRRYLDLVVNPEVKDVFVQRAAIIREVRNYLDSNRFIEVETPALQPLYGGASARPFVTHHNALDQTLYLRIADELYLKRLIIGGFDKVYEIAKNFRNEGMDRNHNPEFTALEFYWAYTDLYDAMTFTEGLFNQLAEALGKSRVTFMGQEIQLDKPFEKATYYGLLSKYSDIDFSDIKNVEGLYSFAEKRKIDLAKGLNYGQALDKLFGLLVEPRLIQPTFITAYPKAISPLAKIDRNGNPDLVERFELFVGGMEFANTFSELNDPIDQRERLEAQTRLREEGDEEAQPIDEDFLEAMEYGMPPMSGVGIGIDRLVMLLTEQDSIKDVILFPAMRPQQS